MALYNEEREGQTPRVTQAGGGNQVVEWQQDPTSFQKSSQILGAIMQTMEQEEVKKQKKLKDKADTYKVLREAGYDPKAAYEAVNSGDYPATTPSTTEADQKSALEKDKLTAETDKIKAETQKITAEANGTGKPLPAGFVDVRGKVFKDPSYKAPRKRSAAEAKMIAQSQTLVSSLTQLDAMVGTKDENYWPMGGGTEGGQKFQTLRDDIKSTLLYLRSGAAVTPQEYSRLSKLLPQLLRKGSVDKEQLQRFKSEFSIILSELQAGKRGPAANEPGTADEGGDDAIAFDTIEEAAAAGLANGTRITVGGRPAVWEDDEEGA